jgi:hypothetical protein
MSEMFVMADGVPGYLEHAGTRIATVYEFGPTVRCRRWEVRHAHAEFQLHDVQLRRHLDWSQWHEISRQVWETYQSRSFAINAVKIIERSYFEAAKDDLLEQMERIRREARLERAEEIEGPEL